MEWLKALLCKGYSLSVRFRSITTDGPDFSFNQIDGENGGLFFNSQQFAILENLTTNFNVDQNIVLV